MARRQRLAGVSAMGIGGVNVHLVLRSAAGRVSRHDRVLRVRPRPARAGSGRDRAACDRPRRHVPAARLLPAARPGPVAAGHQTGPDRRAGSLAVRRRAHRPGRPARPGRAHPGPRPGGDRGQPSGGARPAGRRGHRPAPVLRDGLLATRQGIFAAENADGRVTLLLSDDPALATLSDGPVSGAINGAITAAVSGTQPAPTRVASRRARNARRGRRPAAQGHRLLARAHLPAAGRPALVRGPRRQRDRDRWPRPRRDRLAWPACSARPTSSRSPPCAPSSSAGPPSGSCPPAAGMPAATATPNRSRPPIRCRCSATPSASSGSARRDAG